MGKTLREFNEWALNENLREYSTYFNLLKRIVVSRFEYLNLPKNVPSYFIENSLFENGLVICFKDKFGEIYFSKATEEGLNFYGEGTDFNITFNGELPKTVNKTTFNITECVPVYNNSLKRNSISDVNFFAKKLESVENALRNNLESLKTSVIINCSQEEKLSYEQAYKNRTVGSPVIIVSDKFELSNVKVWDLNAKNYLESFENEKKMIINEFLTFFGLNNTNIIKKERLTSGENEENNEMINSSLYDFYLPRKQAVEKINEMFNLNIELEIKPFNKFEYFDLLFKE